MKRCAWALGLAALLAAGVLTVARGRAQDGDRVPTIKEVMKKLNAGPNSLMANLGKELQQEEPDWAEVQRGAKEFAAFAGHLAENEPPLGSRESWGKLTKKYIDDVKSLEAAARKQDRAAALAAHARLKRSCTACHREHRPKE